MNHSGKRPLLVVEDDGLIRMDLVCMLEDSGYRVIEAANADQAIVLLQDHDVSALLTDIDMPGSMDGLALAEMTAGRWPDCRIVVISGRYASAKGVPPQAKFLTKPISEDQLSSILVDMGVAAN